MRARLNTVTYLRIQVDRLDGRVNVRLVIALSLLRTAYGQARAEH